MPYSMVLELYSADNSGSGGAPITGEHLQAAFLNLVSQADPQLAAELHSGDRLRGYSLGILSPIIHKETARATDHHNRVAARRVLWRIACLDDRVYPALVRVLLAVGERTAATASAASNDPAAYVQEAPRLEVKLGARRFFLARLLATPESGSRWSLYCDANDLIRHASREQPFVKLKFASPTVFRQGNRDESLPTPELVFSGLARRWNAVYGEKLLIPEKEFSVMVGQHVVASEYQLESAQMPDGKTPQGKDLYHTGCIGTVNYQVIGKPDGMVIYLLNLLADIAIFSGLGKKSSRGCGMVRRIS